MYVSQWGILFSHCLKVLQFYYVLFDRQINMGVLDLFPGHLLGKYIFDDLLCSLIDLCIMYMIIILTLFL